MFAFFALAFAWTWSFWLLASLFRTEAPAAAAALGFVGGFGPSLAAVVVVARQGGRRGLHRWLKRCLQWRQSRRWLVPALLFPAVLMVAAAAAHVALGGTLPPSSAHGHFMLVAANFVLVFLVGGPLGEEFGWRGFVLPALQRRWGWRTASLLSGAVWAFWHLPLFFSTGSTQSHLPLGLHALSTVALSVLLAWLCNRTEGSLLPVMVQPDGSNLRPFQLVVGGVVLAALLLMLRDGEGQRERNPGS